MIRFINLLRVIGILEGLSFLILLGIAMPLKYLFQHPEPVAVVGGIHGGLFVVYVLMALLATLVFQMPWLNLVQAILASLIPGGTFWFDRKLRDFQNRTPKSPGTRQS